ncbi:MAG: hypothetical protein ACRENK_05605, partial [Gemmatimonadaceae bacterium]
ALRSALTEPAGDPSAEELLRAAEHLLDKVLRTGCESRSSAVDLLTVDALVTQALLVASEDSNSVEDFPEQALRRVTSAWQ